MGRGWPKTAILAAPAAAGAARPCAPRRQRLFILRAMKLLSEALADDADFFVEQVQITAIVFDNTDDVTVWATTFFDEAPHFFHLGLPFAALDTLLRVAEADRTDALQEEVADALATTEEWPCLLEYTTDARPPVQLPGVALKLAVTYPADEDGEEGEDEETDADADTEEEDDPVPHNVFYLEGVFVKVE